MTRRASGKDHVTRAKNGQGKTVKVLTVAEKRRAAVAYQRNKGATGA